MSNLHWEVVHANCLEFLKDMPDACIDAVVTDPPYGLSKEPDIAEVLRHWLAGDTYEHGGGGFMGKSWDSFVPGPEYWREVCRVLKPGGHALVFAGTRTSDLMGIAVRMGGFERRDELDWMYGCLDDSSEVLTRRGWLHREQIGDEDEVLQWDASDGSLTWIRPEMKVEFPFNGELINIKNRHTDQLLTPNHRVYAKVQRHSRHATPTEYEVLRADEVDDRSSAWRVTLPLAGNLAGGDPVNPQYAYLVGWWLTDAWRHTNGRAVMFSQSKPATLAKLRAALAPHPSSEYVRKATKTTHAPEHVFYVTGELAKTLIKDHPDRRLTWDVLRWSRAARHALFEGLMDGDGSRPTDQHAHAFWSKDRDRLDVFSALCISLGLRSFVDYDKGVVNVNMETSTTELQHRHRAPRVPYKGFVWCLKVPSGAFVARRSGKPFITGNSGFPKSLNIRKAIEEGKAYLSAPSEAAQAAAVTAYRFDGWGTALKPAREPIILARNPLAGTVAANVLAHGTGALNIDACRIQGVKGVPASPCTVDSAVYGKGSSLTNGNTPGFDPNVGRWPANMLLDEEAAALLDEQSGEGRSTASKAPRGKRPRGMGETGERKGDPMPNGPTYSDAGGASRFFYCAKTSRKERDFGCEHLPPRSGAEATDRNEGEAALACPRTGAGRTGGARNGHPTVKPVSLMTYLVRLVCPPGGLVLDPFAGSGSTGMACAVEGFNFIGIEREAEYVELARLRVGAAHARTDELRALISK